MATRRPLRYWIVPSPSCGHTNRAPKNESFGSPWAATAADLFDDEALSRVATRWVELSRERGALTSLPVALAVLANLHQVPEGQFSAAAASLNEAREILSASTANPGILGTYGGEALLLRAWQGHEDEVRSITLASAPEAVSGGRDRLVMYAYLSLAALELGLGNYQAALASARMVYEDDPPWTGTFILPDLVEAAVRTGEHRTAVAALERLSDRALSSQTPLGLGLLARSQALLADDGDAGRLYEEAIEHLEGCRTMTERARPPPPLRRVAASAAAPTECPGSTPHSP